MRFSRLSTIVSLFLFLVSAVPSYAQDAALSENSGSLPGPTEIKTLYSKEVGQDYTLFVYLPETYATSDRRYPVQYILDGDASLDELAVAAGRELGVREMIRVGIGYGMDSPERRPYRLRDLTPEPVGGLENTGGAEAFHRFLNRELAFFLDENYRIDSKDRTLVGHSLGGFFVLYSLFSGSAPSFDKYVVISPSLAIDNFRAERDHFSLPEDDAVKLFLAMGSKEDGSRMHEPFMDFTGELGKSDHSGLIWHSTVIDSADHFSVVLPALKKGFQWIMK